MVLFLFFLLLARTSVLFRGGNNPEHPLVFCFPDVKPRTFHRQLSFSGLRRFLSRDELFEMNIIEVRYTELKFS